MTDAELLNAIVENVLDSDDPEDLARYRDLLEDPERLRALRESLEQIRGPGDEGADLPQTSTNA